MHLRPGLLALLLVLAAVPAADAGTGDRDWPRYGVDAQRSNRSRAPLGLTEPQLGRLRRQRVPLPGTVDSSPIALHGVTVGGRRRNVLVLTTTYGHTLAIDADTGRRLWLFTPPGYDQVRGTAQITHATPLADRAAGRVYAVSPDGLVHALRLGDGRELPGWPIAVTRLPSREKIAPALNLSRGLLLVGTGGYFGDAPPYQGHVVAIDVRRHRIANVWNSLCSDRRGLLDPSSCDNSDSAIWARAGVIVLPGSGRLLAATGNGLFDGRTNFGDSVLELAPDASALLGSFTPRSFRDLQSTDADLGSTAPAVLPGGLLLQGGKDGRLRLLDLARLHGHVGQVGGELQTLPTPGGDALFTTPAVLADGGSPRVFVATGQATAAYVLRGRRLVRLWQNDTPGTSPVIAGGLVFVYDPDGSGLHVYRPDSARPIATLPAGHGHWNTPIAVDGRIALPEGDANDHSTSGVLDIWRP